MTENTWIGDVKNKLQLRGYFEYVSDIKDLLPQVNQGLKMLQNDLASNNLPAFYQDYQTLVPLGNKLSLRVELTAKAIDECLPNDADTRSRFLGKVMGTATKLS